MKSTTRLIQAGSTIALALVLAACNQKTQPQAACGLSDSNNVDHLFAEVSDKLDTKACHYSFPMYRERLLQAAKGAPKPPMAASKPPAEARLSSCGSSSIPM